MSGVSTVTGVQDAAEAGRAPWPRRVAEHLAGLPPGAAAALGVLAWIAALAVVAVLVRGYLIAPPDQRLVDLDVYRTSGLSVLQGQPLYSVLTQPPQLLSFTYPPAAALFAVPLALLSWPAARRGPAGWPNTWPGCRRGRRRRSACWPGSRRWPPSPRWYGAT